MVRTSEGPRPAPQVKGHPTNSMCAGRAMPALLAPSAIPPLTSAQELVCPRGEVLLQQPQQEAHQEAQHQHQHQKQRLAHVQVKAPEQGQAAGLEGAPGTVATAAAPPSLGPGQRSHSSDGGAPTAAAGVGAQAGAAAGEAVAEVSMINLAEIEDEGSSFAWGLQDGEPGERGAGKSKYGWGGQLGQGLGQLQGSNGSAAGGYKGRSRGGRGRGGKGRIQQMEVGKEERRQQQRAEEEVPGDGGRAGGGSRGRGDETHGSSIRGRGSGGRGGKRRRAQQGEDVVAGDNPEGGGRGSGGRGSGRGRGRQKRKAVEEEGGVEEAAREPAEADPLSGRPVWTAAAAGTFPALDASGASLAPAASASGPAVRKPAGSLASFASLAFQGGAAPAGGQTSGKGGTAGGDGGGMDRGEDGPASSCRSGSGVLQGAGSRSIFATHAFSGAKRSDPGSLVKKEEAVGKKEREEGEVCPKPPPAAAAAAAAATGPDCSRQENKKGTLAGAVGRGSGPKRARVEEASTDAAPQVCDCVRACWGEKGRRMCVCARVCTCVCVCELVPLYVNVCVCCTNMAGIPSHVSKQAARACMQMAPHRSLARALVSIHTPLCPLRPPDLSPKPEGQAQPSPYAHTSPLASPPLFSTCISMIWIL